ncbi:hypothetical protein GQ53DRAFT_508608 [Thozetella sp. PMI_491]|nr:hypothetical protein GQ53DRAFT_508608 [Thozetella sp. PMI_491]
MAPVIFFLLLRSVVLAVETPANQARWLGWFGEGSAPAAELVLYPGSRIHPLDLVDLRRELNPCPESGPATKVRLALGICLSGEYYLQDNLKITRLPDCEDGSAPTVRFYQRRRCLGEAIVFEASKIPNSCLWSQSQVPDPSYYWSLVISCKSSRPHVSKHLEVNPPTIIGPRVGRHGRVKAMYDQYGHIIQFWVDELAICQDGTRARLAWAVSTTWDNLGDTSKIQLSVLEDQLVDIGDGEARRWIGANEDFSSPNRIPDLAKGVVFHCGSSSLPPTESKLVYPGHLTPADASVSHVDSLDEYGGPRALRWMPVAVGACVNLPAGKIVAMSSNAVCADKWPAHFAVWHGPDCSGPPQWVGRSPDRISPEPDPLSTKNSVMVSYSFWCQKKEGVIEAARRARRGVYSDHACTYALDETYNYEPPNPPPLYIMEPGECFRGYGYGGEWEVYQNAVCSDGSTAKLGLWSDLACTGPPVLVEVIPRDKLNKCITMCPGFSTWRDRNCSRAFLCPKPRAGSVAVEHGSRGPFLPDKHRSASFQDFSRAWAWWVAGVFVGLFVLLFAWQRPRYSRFVRSWFWRLYLHMAGSTAS